MGHKLACRRKRWVRRLFPSLRVTSCGAVIFPGVNESQCAMGILGGVVRGQYANGPMNFLHERNIFLGKR